MITCKTVTRLHTEALEGALSGWNAFRYRFHMRICGPCRAYERGLEQTIEALHGVEKEKAPDELKQAALAALKKRRGCGG